MLTFLSSQNRVVASDLPLHDARVSWKYTALSLCHTNSNCKSFLHHVLLTWKTHFIVFVIVFTEAHRILSRLDIVKGVSFLLATIYYHISETNTDSSISILNYQTYQNSCIYKQAIQWPKLHYSIDPWPQVCNMFHTCSSMEQQTTSNLRSANTRCCDFLVIFLVFM